VYADGQTHVFSTESGSVAEVLKRAAVAVGPNDLVEPSLDADVSKNFFNINVYRARPVLVVDGNGSYRIFSAYQNAHLLAQQAGLKLYPEDGYSIEMISDIVSDGAIGAKVTVNRSVPLMVRADGQDRKIRTLAINLGDALAGAGISLGLKDTVEPALSSSVIPGMSVKITRVTVVDTNITEKLPMSVKTINDATLASGQTKVQVEGADGHKTALYRLHYKDGVVVSRELLKMVEIVNPVQRVVVVGTKVPYVGSADRAATMSAAGISEADYGYVDFIVDHESGWGVTKSNYQGSGAYGLGQALPASKMAPFGSDYLTNPVTQLKWAQSYAVSRYGSWEGAYIFWKAHKNW
jgi:uncharacterized protein YabE (DUF348 family)